MCMCRSCRVHPYVFPHHFRKKLGGKNFGHDPTPLLLILLLILYTEYLLIFPVQLTTSRIGNLTRLIHTLLYVMIIHPYIRVHTVLILYRNVSARWWKIFLRRGCPPGRCRRSPFWICVSSTAIGTASTSSYAAAPAAPPASRSALSPETPPLTTAIAAAKAASGFRRLLPGCRTLVYRRRGQVLLLPGMKEDYLTAEEAREGGDQVGCSAAGRSTS